MFLDANQRRGAAGRFEMPGGDESIATVVAFAGNKDGGARVASLEKWNARFRHGEAGALHQFFLRRAGGDGAAIEFAHLLGGDGFHVVSLAQPGGKKQRPDLWGRGAVGER
jgi:hypothetical protein